MHRLNRILFWDAMIVQAARVVSAAVLYSEDLADGSSVAGVAIRNPFAAI
jgi:predicted nucleic acid-binding protein